MSKLNEIRCPTCGKKGLRAVTRTVKTRANKRTLSVPGVADIVHRAEAHLTRELIRTLALFDAVQRRRIEPASLPATAKPTFG